MYHINFWRLSNNATMNWQRFLYSEVYESPDDIDLWSAGISERPQPGSMVGPVFGCIMGETFRNLRQGDRFWYEHSNHPGSFTHGKISYSKSKLSYLDQFKL